MTVDGTKNYFHLSSNFSTRFTFVWLSLAMPAEDGWVVCAGEGGRH